MGKPTSSCLKIITCGGGESTGGEDLTPAVSKASSDKPRWSFRKRSARHRVLSNNLISEPVSVGCNKENPEATTNDSRSPKNLSVSEKAYIEDPTLSSAIVDSVVDPLVIGRNSTITDHNLEDSFAVVIQAAIRGYLAQRELLKIKNVIKLQATVRGHLVRREAVGTLRCIQAIVKIQTLVRAQHARQYGKRLSAKEDGKKQLETEKSTLVGNAASCIEPDKTYSYSDKLLSNRFACQLLESNLKTKYIHIKCDPSRSDSSWKWLERWMAVMSSYTEKELEQNIFQGSQVPKENAELVAYEAATDAPVAVVSASSDSLSAPSDSAVPTRDEGNSIIENSATIEFQAPAVVPNDCFSSLPKSDHDQSQLESEALVMAPERDAKIDSILEKSSNSHSGQMPLLSDATSEPVLNSISDKPDSDCNDTKQTSEQVSFDPLENEGKSLVLDSRKPCNPAFAAAQSKFEELSSTTVVWAESEFGSSNSQIHSLTKTEDLSLTENSVTHDPRAQIATSECGTEISISSTLDSPDRSEAEGGEIVLEIEDMGKGNCVIESGADNGFNHVSGNAVLKSTSLDSQFLQPQRPEESNVNLANLIAAEVEQQPEGTTMSDMKNQIDNLIDSQVYRSSPEGTPKSHTTVSQSHGTQSSVPESHGTPSSMPVNAKKSKKDSSMPTRKKRIQLVGNKSPSDPNNGSGGRRSTECLPNDSKNAKRRNSFGAAKLDHADHEPRVSNSNSLPSYMQATESAKAKIHASISPKSSPDVHEKENYAKKRRSLPIGNEKQGSSPRMQMSPSQAQQNPKGNGTHSPHNSAERRWQR